MSSDSLNAICPYFTMFPLSFPKRVLARAADTDGSVLDPFCGRGTTNMAARLRGMPTIGIDSHPLATAVTRAKLISTSPRAIISELNSILDEPTDHGEIPSGDFWSLMYHAETLETIVHVRNNLIHNCRSAERIALRAVILGALHGPLGKYTQSYLSNQSPRTYAPKPRYAVRFWKRNKLHPPRVDLTEIVSQRAKRYYQTPIPTASSQVRCADSRDPKIFADLSHGPVGWVITSPPYYGLNTYLPDQWIRLWFLGGPPTVDYRRQNQLEHTSPEHYAQQLAQVWSNCRKVAKPGARMVIRFGGISSRPVDPIEIARASLHNTGWHIQTRCDAGTALQGKRQGDQFGVRSTARTEFDLWAIKAD